MIELFNDYGRLWAEFFVPALVQNTVFLVLVFLALRIFRNASASVKYAIAAVGLVKLLLPPFVPTSAFVPAAGEQVAFPASTLLFSFTDLSAGADTAPIASPAGLDLFGALFIVWTAAVLFVIVRALRSTARLAANVKGAEPIGGDPVIESSGAASDARIGVYRSDRIGVPLTIGVLPHRIYVPDAWSGWSPECRSAVLKHEIAHIRRRDGLFQALEIVVQALYFFHPMVWILNRRLRAYREMACDDASVGLDRSSRLHYSKVLVELAEAALHPPVACESASALMRKKHDLLARVAYQVKEGDMLSLSKKKMAVILAALIVAMLPFSMYVRGADNAATDVAKAGVTGELKKGEPLTSVSVVIKSDKLVVDGQKTSMENFGDYMAKIASKENPNSVLTIITCDGDVPMANLYQVQKQLLKNNLYKVTYTDGEGHKMPIVLPSDDVKKKMGKVSKEDILFLKVDASGYVFVNKEQVKQSKVTKVVEKMLADNPNLIISVYTDEKTSYKDFTYVFAQIQEAGATRVMVNNPAG